MGSGADGRPGAAAGAGEGAELPLEARRGQRRARNDAVGGQGLEHPGPAGERRSGEGSPGDGATVAGEVAGRKHRPSLPHAPAPEAPAAPQSEPRVNRKREQVRESSPVTGPARPGPLRTGHSPRARRQREAAGHGRRAPEGRKLGRKLAAGPGGESLLTPSPSPAAGSPAQRFRLGRARRRGARRVAGAASLPPLEAHADPAAAHGGLPASGIPAAERRPARQSPTAGWARRCGARRDNLGLRNDACRLPAKSLCGQRRAAALRVEPPRRGSLGLLHICTGLYTRIAVPLQVTVTAPQIRTACCAF
nr:collagen alpha-1(I) chain-like [Caretta caretta]